jgi:hypothetical protein
MLKEALALAEQTFGSKDGDVVTAGRRPARAATSREP